MTAVTVTRVSTHEVQLLLGDQELWLPFAEFPWLKHATIEELRNVERPRPGHLYWPQLDVDLSIESIRHSERFPLASKTAAVSEATWKASAQLGSSK